MSGLLQAAIVVAYFVAANVVAAGVVLVLGLAFRPPVDVAWPWILISVAGIMAAFYFLKGAVFFAAERSRLQSRQGRRGG